MYHDFTGLPGLSTVLLLLVNSTPLGVSTIHRNADAVSPLTLYLVIPSVLDSFISNRKIPRACLVTSDQCLAELGEEECDKKLAAEEKERKKEREEKWKQKQEILQEKQKHEQSFNKQ